MRCKVLTSALALLVLTGPSALAQRTQVRFTRPSGMKVRWYVRTPDGKESYSEPPIEVPGRYNFRQAAIYRLKLANIEGHPGLELYPTLEVVPADPKSRDFLAHSAVPLGLTKEDVRQVLAGNYLVKVIYLPGPQFQGEGGLGEVVGTQLEPGTDPIQEAQRRGRILLVLRIGNRDLEVPKSPGGK